MKFQITQVSNVGTSNPIVARLSMGLDDIIKMAQIPGEKRTQILECCVEIMHALVEAEKSAKPLLDEMRQIEQKIATEGIKVQPNAIETPGVMNLQNSRVFLKWAKQALQWLAKAMGIIFDKNFDGPHFHKIRDEVKKVLGSDHVVSRLLDEDQNWIKEIIDLRNEDEHPTSGKAFVVGYDIREVTPGQYRVNIPRFFNDSPVLNRIEIFTHNILTFSEEMIAHSLEHFFPRGVAVCDIPEDQRNPVAPIRYRLGWKEGFPIVPNTGAAS